MRKSGSTRGSPNLVILCLRKVVSLRKIKFLQKGTFGKTLGEWIVGMTRVQEQKHHDAYDSVGSLPKGLQC
ncbi:hypothetical protein L3X38_038120 [Prunus dulcis]|uniref:Uncharacterized protein n=1 Tax=Prunus dulcis TaxID=3755 RepID=A0AAD4YQ67_PRUDU|nr:hypothetical protein L3X38_038120 [Prunus dulcis]